MWGFVLCLVRFVWDLVQWHTAFFCAELSCASVAECRLLAAEAESGCKSPAAHGPGSCGSRMAESVL